MSAGRLLIILLCAVGLLSSTFWLVGYARAIQPFIEDGVPDGFAFLAYPHVKWYQEKNHQTGEMSEMQIDWFSVSDGPTGVIYAHRHIPCWIVSVIALFCLAGSVAGIVSLGWPSRPGIKPGK